MPQRKLARKASQGSARNLRLVPDPEPAPAPRRRRRRKPSWFKLIGRSRRRSYQNHRELHAYEDRLILVALRQHGPLSARALSDLEPGRWHTRELLRAMKRMRHQRLLTSGGTVVSFWPSTIFSINQPEEDHHGSQPTR